MVDFYPYVIIITVIAKSFYCIYEGESKVLQYFSNVRHNSAALYAFAKVMNVTTDTDRCEIPRSTDTLRISLNGQCPDIGIHDFKSTQHCMIS